MFNVKIISPLINMKSVVATDSSNNFFVGWTLAGSTWLLTHTDSLKLLFFICSAFCWLNVHSSSYITDVNILYTQKLLEESVATTDFIFISGDIILTLNMVKSHFSFISCTDIVQVFQSMFSDDMIANKWPLENRSMLHLNKRTYIYLSFDWFHQIWTDSKDCRRACFGSPRAICLLSYRLRTYSEKPVNVY
jgi:hypothetical protein